MHQLTLQKIKEMRHDFEMQLHQLQSIVRPSGMQEQMIKWLQSALSIFKDPMIHQLFSSKGPKKKSIQKIIANVNERLVFLFQSIDQIKMDLTTIANQDDEKMKKWQMEKSEWQLKVSEWASAIGIELPSLIRFRSILPSHLDASKCTLKPLTLENGLLKLPYQSQVKLNDLMTVSLDISSSKTYSEPIGDLTNGFLGNFFEIKQLNQNINMDNAQTQFYGEFDAHASLQSIIDQKQDTWIEIERYYCNEQQKSYLPIGADQLQLPNGDVISHLITSDDFVLKAMIRIRLGSAKTINGLEIDYMIPPFSDAKAPEIELIQITDGAGNVENIVFSKATDTKITFDPIMASSILIGFKQANRYATQMGFLTSDYAFFAKQSKKSLSIEKTPILLSVLDRNLSTMNDEYAEKQMQYYYESANNQEKYIRSSVSNWIASKYKSITSFRLKAVRGSRYVIGIRNINLLQNQYHSQGEYVTKPIIYQDPIQSVQLDVPLVDSKYEPYTTYCVSINDGLTWLPILPRKKQIGPLDETTIPKMYLFSLNKETVNTTLAYTKIISVTQPVYQIRFQIKIVLPQNQLNTLQLFAENDSQIIKKTPSIETPMLETIHGNSSFASVLQTADLFSFEEDKPISSVPLPMIEEDDSEQSTENQIIEIEPEDPQPDDLPDQTPLEDDELIETDFELPVEPIIEPTFEVTWNAKTVSKCAQDAMAIEISAEASEGISNIQLFENGELVFYEDKESETDVTVTFSFEAGHFEIGKAIVLRLFVMDARGTVFEDNVYFTSMDCSDRDGKTYQESFIAPGNCEAIPIGTSIVDPNPIVEATWIQANGSKMTLTVLDGEQGIIDLPCEIAKNESIVIEYKRKKSTENPGEGPVRNCLQFEYVAISVYEPLESSFVTTDIFINEFPYVLSNGNGSSVNITWSNTENGLVIESHVSNSSSPFLIGAIVLRYVNELDVGFYLYPVEIKDSFRVDRSETILTPKEELMASDALQLNGSLAFVIIGFSSEFHSNRCPILNDWEKPVYTAPAIVLNPLPSTVGFHDVITISGQITGTIFLDTLVFTANGSSTRMMNGQSVLDYVQNIVSNANQTFVEDISVYDFSFDMEISTYFMSGDQIKIQATATNDASLSMTSNTIVTTIEERIPSIVLKSSSAVCVDQQSSFSFELKAIESKTNEGELTKFQLFGSEKMLYEQWLSGATQTVDVLIPSGTFEIGSQTLHAFAYNDHLGIKEYSFVVNAVDCVSDPVPSISSSLNVIGCPPNQIVAHVNVSNLSTDLTKIEIVNAQSELIYRYTSLGYERNKVALFDIPVEKLNTAGTHVWTIRAYGMQNGVETSLLQTSVQYTLLQSCLIATPVVEEDPITGYQYKPENSYYDSSNTTGHGFELIGGSPNVYDDPGTDLHVFIFNENCQFVRHIRPVDISNQSGQSENEKGKVYFSSSTETDYVWFSYDRDDSPFDATVIPYWDYQWNREKDLYDGMPLNYGPYGGKTMAGNEKIFIKGLEKYTFFIGYSSTWGEEIDARIRYLRPQIGKIAQINYGYVTVDEVYTGWQIIETNEPSGAVTLASTPYSHLDSRYQWSNYGPASNQVHLLYQLSPQKNELKIQKIDQVIYAPPNQNSSSLTTACSTGLTSIVWTKTVNGSLSVSPQTDQEGNVVNAFAVTYTAGEAITNGYVQFELPSGFAAPSNATVKIGSQNARSVSDSERFVSSRTLFFENVTVASGASIQLSFPNFKLPASNVYYFSAYADADGRTKNKTVSNASTATCTITTKQELLTPESKPIISYVQKTDTVCIDQNETFEIQATITDVVTIKEVHLTWSIQNDAYDFIIAPYQYTNLSTKNVALHATIPSELLSAFVNYTIRFSIVAINSLGLQNEALPNDAFEMKLVKCVNQTIEAPTVSNPYSYTEPIERVLPSNNQLNPAEPFTPTTPYLIAYDRPYQSTDRIWMNAEWGNIPSAYEYAYLWKKNEIDNVYWSYNNSISFASNVMPTEQNNLSYYNTHGMFLVGKIPLTTTSRKQLMLAFEAQNMDMNYTIKAQFFENYTDTTAGLTIEYGFHTPFVSPPGQLINGQPKPIYTYVSSAKTLSIHWFVPANHVDDAELLIRKNGVQLTYSLKNQTQFALTETSMYGGIYKTATCISSQIKSYFTASNTGIISIRLNDGLSNRKYPDIRKKINW